MNNRIKFHLDEQVKSVIALELRRRGIDLTTSVSEDFLLQIMRSRVKLH
ncbi:MAG: hypothetical protein QNJ70_07850 [Xenococcaceae cyanobacterium MO_207.B15]|nr:hypothetical protein [Xenococcaceae cyanobacterium MO_207.B15]MDJ0747191.1 hypothetical protein [Xenococcaceae cyanobacterium MO_167.B27]